MTGALVSIECVARFRKYKPKVCPVCKVEFTPTGPAQVVCTLSDCSAELDSTRANLETTLGGSLDQVYTTVKSRAAFGAKVIVLGYPRVFSGASCFGTLGITSTEQSKANALADALDQVIARHAAADGVTYQSAISRFTGHAVCSSSAWVNGLNLLNTGESYQPNRPGQSSGYLPLVTAITG